jgi:hypothetical protein
MKQISNMLAKLSLVITGILFSLVSVAQDKGTDITVDINKGDGGNWYAQPWVWIVGGAVFILLLVALLKSNRAKE